MLGSSCSIPRPGRACSGYLVEAEGLAIVADLGSGALANALYERSAESIDAVVISHMHADHFIDLVPLRYALRYGARSHDRRVSVYLPPDGTATLRRLVGAFARESGAEFLDAFDVREYDPERELRLGDVRLRFAPTRHYIPTFAVRFDVASASLTYSADTAPTRDVERLARGCTALLCEATLAPTEERDVERGHLSAREAGALATAADARRLLLTHYPASADPAALARDAAAAFSGPIAVVDDRDAFTIA